MNKKTNTYKFSVHFMDSIKGPSGAILYRIQAEKDIQTCVGLVRAGTKGGYVWEGEVVGRDDNSWCFPEGKIDKGGSVRGEAVVMSGTLDSPLKENVILDEQDLLDVSKKKKQPTTKNQKFKTKN